MEVNLIIPQSVFYIGFIVMVIIVYSIFGAITAGIACRYGFEGNAAPPGEFIGAIWPIVLIVFLIVILTIFVWKILSWTLFLPAWFVYRMVVNYKSEK